MKSPASVLSFVFFLPGLVSPAYATPATLRVDYFHTGNAKEERFSLGRIVAALPGGRPAGAAPRAS